MRTILAAILLLGAVRGGWADAESSNASSGGVRSLGVGLNWAHQQMGGSLNDQNPGGVTARYWFSERWGGDAGVGAGFPTVSRNSIYLVSLEAEGMRAIKRSGASVLYADLLVMPGIAHINGGQVNGVFVDSGQHGTAFAISVSAGLGFETALADFSRLRWFAQFNPVSYEHTAPAPGSLVRNSSAVDLLGSNMVLSMGFHYQF